MLNRLSQKVLENKYFFNNSIIDAISKYNPKRTISIFATLDMKYLDINNLKKSVLVLTKTLLKDILTLGYELIRSIDISLFK